MQLADVADEVGMKDLGDLLRTMPGGVTVPGNLESAVVKLLTATKDQGKKTQLNDALKIIRSS